MAVTPEDFPLHRELEVFEAHRTWLLARAAGKYALVRGDEVCDDVFDTEGDAVQAGYRMYGYVAFLAKQITEADVPEVIPYAITA